MLFLVFVLEYFACSTPNNQQIKPNQPNLTTKQDLNRPSTHESIPAPTTETPKKCPPNQLINQQTECQANISAFF
jgi:hypothetical protein